mmetsp:Transcript_47925/g.139692  ORF Transcript_47925/g.139692 Transcript_47925/m.139692 type:complete len:268 (-) Transcript_47925:113-916(-)
MEVHVEEVVEVLPLEPGQPRSPGFVRLFLLPQEVPAARQEVGDQENGPERLAHGDEQEQLLGTVVHEELLDGLLRLGEAPGAEDAEASDASDPAQNVHLLQVGRLEEGEQVQTDEKGIEPEAPGEVPFSDGEARSDHLPIFMQARVECEEHVKHPEGEHRREQGLVRIQVPSQLDRNEDDVVQDEKAAHDVPAQVKPVVMPERYIRRECPLEQHAEREEGAWGLASVHGDGEGPMQAEESVALREDVLCWRVRFRLEHIRLQLVRDV